MQAQTSQIQATKDVTPYHSLNFCTDTGECFGFWKKPSANEIMFGDLWADKPVFILDKSTGVLTVYVGSKVPNPDDPKGRSSTVKSVVVKRLESLQSHGERK